MNLWNEKNLLAPPVSTYKTKTRCIDLLTLRKIISDAIYVLKRPAVTKEAALLSRCIYRMKKKFRNDKGFKNMEKMNRVLLQMLRLSFPDVLNNYLATIPTKYEADTYLPTLNMLHYLLVRLQGLSKLLVRLCEVSKCAACFMQERVHIAHMWKVAFIIFGMIARIYVLGKTLLKFCCDFYNQLYLYCSKFKNIGANWLPKEYILPTDLKIWLDIDWLDNYVDITEPVHEADAISSLEVLDADSDRDVEFLNEYTDVPEDDIITAKSIYVSDEDIGELVAAAPTEPKKKKKHKKKQKNNNITYNDLQVNTFDDLKRITKDFNKIKTENPNVFKNVDKLQCNMLHSLIKKTLKKAKKCRTDDSVITKCITDVKDLLKLYLKV